MVFFCILGAPSLCHEHEEWNTQMLSHCMVDYLKGKPENAHPLPNKVDQMGRDIQFNSLHSVYEGQVFLIPCFNSKLEF